MEAANDDDEDLREKRQAMIDILTHPKRVGYVSLRNALADDAIFVSFLKRVVEICRIPVDDIAESGRRAHPRSNLAVQGWLRGENLPHVRTRLKVFEGRILSVLRSRLIR